MLPWSTEKHFRCIIVANDKRRNVALCSDDTIVLYTAFVTKFKANASNYFLKRIKYLMISYETKVKFVRSAHNLKEIWVFCRFSSQYLLQSCSSLPSANRRKFSTKLVIFLQVHNSLIKKSSLFKQISIKKYQIDIRWNTLEDAFSDSKVYLTKVLFLD